MATDDNARCGACGAYAKAYDCGCIVCHSCGTEGFWGTPHPVGGPGCGRRACQSVRYAPRKPCAEDGPKWDVVTYTRSRDTDPWKITLRHPACFVHALAEVDGYASIVGSARVEFIEAGTMPPGVVEEIP